MVLEDIITIPIVIVLTVIILLIDGTIAASLLWPGKELPDLPVPPDNPEN